VQSSDLSGHTPMVVKYPRQAQVTAVTIVHLLRFEVEAAGTGGSDGPGLAPCGEVLFMQQPALSSQIRCMATDLGVDEAPAVGRFRGR
jgi:hypothetical protein